MLNHFDWLRQSRTGAELLATLQLFASNDEIPFDRETLGPPHSALSGPCQRCWVYSPSKKRRYCPMCQEILNRAWRLGGISRNAIVLWGFVNQLPRQLHTGSGFQDSRTLGTYVHDENHFLLMLYQRELKPWLQELALYHGADLKGFMQIFPTVGTRYPNMGELISRIVYNESRFPMDRLWVRFFSDLQQVFKPHLYEREGVLTFEITDFLSTLEMATVFRTVMRPEEQRLLQKLVQMEVEGVGNVQFYWGRILSHFSQEAKDMLNAWRIRQWPKAQIDLLYELVQYVTFYQSN
jgi:hypothetical protein